MFKKIKTAFLKMKIYICDPFKRCSSLVEMNWLGVESFREVKEYWETDWHIDGFGLLMGFVWEKFENKMIKVKQNKIKY